MLRDNIRATPFTDSLDTKGMRIAHVIMIDNQGDNTTISLTNALYFPDSPVNIISVAYLADHYDDDYDTYIKVFHYLSEFTWDFKQYTETINAEGQMPEIGAWWLSSIWNTCVAKLGQQPH